MCMVRVNMKHIKLEITEEEFNQRLQLNNLFAVLRKILGKKFNKPI